MKPTIIISAGVACLALAVMWLFTGPRVEVHGSLSEHDVAELKRLARIETRRQFKSDFSRQDVRHLPRLLWRMVCEKVVQIDQERDGKALVTTGTARAQSGGGGARYLFVNTKDGWKLSTPEFE